MITRSSSILTRIMGVEEPFGFQGIKLITVQETINIRSITYCLIVASVPD
jgi:hypothetical protein